MMRHTPARPLNSIVGKSCVVALAALGFWQAPTISHAAVTAGGIAILGFTDNNDLFDDTFSIAALEQINAGTIIYFTDNGWNTADAKFRGATNLDGNGAETLIKLEFTSNVAAGTIMRSENNAAEFTWDVSSLPIGASNGNYSVLALAAGGTGEQIYAFEAAASLPLLNPSNHIYLLDMGDVFNPGFEDADESDTGNIAPGLSEVANTAVTLPDNSAIEPDANDFHNGSFALNMLDFDVVTLNASGGTKAQWLALIADSANWMAVNYEDDSEGDAEAQLSTLNIAGVPEPSRVLLLALGGFMAGLRRRRTAA